MPRLSLLAALVAVLVLSPVALAQDGDVSSVSIRPSGTTTSDPNGGRWFVGEGLPGDVVRFRVVVANPANVDQRVTLYLADLHVDDEGRPVVGDRGAGVGAWGGFETPELLVPAGDERTADFAVTVPPGTDPGDHLAAVVAESAPTGDGNVGVVKRVAKRFYVTVPGDARTALELVEVDVDPERAVLPRWATVTVTLRNTGGIRLRPVVEVDGARAAGSELLMSQSIERYVVRTRLPVWGGPVDVDVDVRSRTERGEGPALHGRGRTSVFPLLPLLVVLLLVLGLLSARRLPRRRTRYDELAEELRRLEQQLAVREKV